MSDRDYHHGCPRDFWENGIDFLPKEYKDYAESRIGQPDTYLMKSMNNNYGIKENWVYFTTHKYSEKMERVIEIYLESLAWESYGAY